MCRMRWKTYMDGGACAGGAHLEMSAKFANAFTHPGNSNTGAVRRVIQVVEMFLRNSLTVIVNLEFEIVSVAL